MQHGRIVLLSAVMTAVLVACGGGGGDSNGASSAGTNSTPTQTQTPAASLKISGTAATGLALANATVEAKCASGTASATTAADGTFTLTLPQGAAAPCVLRVALPDASTLHSMLPAGAEGAAVANITPLTQLLLATLANADPAEVFSGFGAAAQASLNTPAIGDALKKLAASLSGVVDLSGVDPLAGKLVAATTGGAAGNAQDQLLDQLKAQLAQLNVQLAQLSTALASSPGTDAPVKTLLQPAATNCASLRSGTYNVMAGGETLTVDASALTVTAAGSAPVTLLPGAQRCSFAFGGDVPGSVVVSNSGVILARSAPQGQAPFLEIMIPAQKLPKSEFAGTWSVLGYEMGGGNAAANRLGHTAVKLTFDDAGDFVSGAECTKAGCEAWPAADRMTVAARDDGSFALTDAYGVTTARLFKNANGQTAMFLDAGDGMLFGSKEVADTLPAVGAVSQSFDLTINPLGGADVFVDHRATVATVDTAAQSFTRTARVSGGVAQPEDQLSVNSPRLGLRYRTPTTGVSEFTALAVRGAGFSAVQLTQANGTQLMLLSTSKAQ